MKMWTEGFAAGLILAAFASPGGKNRAYPAKHLLKGDDSKGLKAKLEGLAK